MLRAKNLASFDASVKRWFDAVEEAAADVAVGLAQEAFEQILETGPQFSGDFVANTKVSFGTLVPSFQAGLFPPGPEMTPFQMGSPQAIQYAKEHANWSKIKLGQSIFVHNSATHDEPYAWKIEKGEINLRPVNEGGDHVFQRSLTFVRNRHAVISSPAHLAALRRIGV